MLKDRFYFNSKCNTRTIGPQTDKFKTDVLSKLSKSSKTVYLNYMNSEYMAAKIFGIL